QNISWGSKEQEEQNFVTKEIINKLKEFGGNITTSSQHTQKAGPVEHLLTWVSSD
ncbi:MAG TPA: isochorismate synthase, partial [Cryomorphaceae bacterium]|nr:isochorismate synthase [Cryomorphaceae bacterium]